MPGLIVDNWWFAVWGFCFEDEFSWRNYFVTSFWHYSQLLWQRQITRCLTHRKLKFGSKEWFLFQFAGSNLIQQFPSWTFTDRNTTTFTVHRFWLAALTIRAIHLFLLVMSYSRLFTGFQALLLVWRAIFTLTNGIGFWRVCFNLENVGSKEIPKVERLMSNAVLAECRK